VINPPPEVQSEIVHRLPIKRARSLSSEITRWLVVGSISGVLAVVLLAGSLIGAIYLAAHSDQERQVDAIIVMGAAQFNGVPSQVLRARLDTTYRAWSDGMAPLIIVTGGKMPGDMFTESESSRDYLVDKGVPEEDILLEGEGRDSAESLDRAADIAHQHNIKTVLIVSDGFHLFRSKMIAEHNGLTAYGLPCDDSPIESGSRTEFDYIIREAAGVVAYLVL
jgi:uncharacterized SAM-binding protein YcdF (DUF218 family)